MDSMGKQTTDSMGKQTTDHMASTLNEVEEAIIHDYVVSGSFLVPMVLNACIELNVLEIIHKAGPSMQLSSHAIASHLPTSNPDAPHVLDRMLYLLCCYSLLTCSVETLEDDRVQRRYGLAPAGKFYLKNTESGSLSTFAVLTSHRAIMDMRFHFKDAVLEGGYPFEKANGVSIFKYREKDPRFGEAYNIGMSEHSTFFMKQILNTYHGFEGLSSLVDVGGGNGAMLHLIISKYPSIKGGVNLDLADVIRHAQPYKGIEHVDGNMFEDVPKGDAMLVKQVFHNWSDADCLRILRNCHKALPSNGKVIIIDLIMSTAPDTTIMDKFICHYDNLMFGLLGARERAENEFKALAIGAGFSKFRLVCCVCGFGVMELHK